MSVDIQTKLKELKEKYEKEKNKHKYIFRKLNDEIIHKVLHSDLPLKLQYEFLKKEFKLKKGSLSSYRRYLIAFFKDDYENYLRRTGNKRNKKQKNTIEKEENSLATPTQATITTETTNQAPSSFSVANEFIIKTTDCYKITFGNYENLIIDEKDTYIRKLEELKQEINLNTYKQKQFNFYRHTARGFVEEIVNGEIVQIRFPFHAKLKTDIENQVLLKQEFLGEELLIAIKQGYIYIVWDAITPINYYSYDTIQTYQNLKLS
ncbi:hypothetical protein OWM07_03160 [Deferribacter thermophilus]|uniref:hypothetical protein n=1 Tax=Deferribacter thermophilus TaxID=53573 RepID=UPI003C298737